MKGIKDTRLCSYAMEVLRQKKIHILQDGEEILNKEGMHIYNIRKPLQTRVLTCEAYQTPSNIKTLSYNELSEMGFMIVARIPKIRYYKGQKFVYYIVEDSSEKYGADYGGVPQLHGIEMDINNRQVRLVGPFSNPTGLLWGPWIDLPKEKATSIIKAENTAAAEAYRMMKQWNPAIEEEFMEVPVPELPILRTESNDLVCIKYIGDEPTIGIIGEKRTGKTFCMISILSHAHHKWNVPSIILNAKMREYESFTLPQEDVRMIKDLEFYNEEPRPLPLVFLHPERKPNLTWDEMDFPGTVGLRISLPFKEALLDFNVMFGKVSKGAAKRLRNMLYNRNGELNEDVPTDDIEAFEEFVIAKVTEDIVKSKGKPSGAAGMSDAINSTVRDYYNQNFFDISNKINPYWQVTKEEIDGKLSKPVTFYPHFACLYAGVIPVIQTRTIIDKFFFQNYFKFLVRNLIEMQRTRWSKENQFRFWAFVDELGRIADTRLRNMTLQILEELVTEGGPNRIGTVYANQNWRRVPEIMRNNTNYKIIFRQHSADLKLITSYERGEGWERNGRWIKTIKELKPLQAVITTTSTPFVVYDQQGRRKETTEPQVGTIVPPLCKYSKPRDV